MRTTGDRTRERGGLASFLRAHRDALLEEWTDRVRSLRAARNLSQEQVLDDVPGLLERLAAATEPGPDPVRAEVHVRERLRTSFELTDVIIELSLLRECAVSGWRRTQPAGDPRAEEALHRAFDQTMVTAAEGYGEVRDRVVRALDRISSVALTAESLDETLQALVTAFGDESPTAESVAILLREGELLRVRAASGRDAEPMGATIRLGEGFAGQIAAQRRPGHLCPPSEHALHEPGARVLFGVPLLHRDELLGVAVMTTRAAHELSTQDRVLFGSMAARVTAALHQDGLRATNERRAHQLEESEARYRATFESAGVGIAELGLDGVWLRLNERFCDILGYSHEELLGLRWQDVTHPDDVEADVLQSGRLAEGAIDSYQVEKRYVRKDGRIVWVQLTMAVLRAPTGAPAQFIAAAQDITSAKRMRERLELLASASAQLVSTLDHQECIEQVARIAVPALADWCGVMVERSPAAAELELRAVAHRDPARVDLVWEAQRGRPPQAPRGLLDRVRRGGRPELLTEIDEDVLRGLARDEEHLAFLRRLGLRSLLLAPLRAREHTFGMLLLAHAESERRFEEDDLGSAKLLAERAAMAIDNAHLHEEACRAVQLRDQILAIVSHDLRNPLSAIDLGSQLLRESAIAQDDTVAKRQAEIIQRNTARMARLIGDLLDVSSIQAGKLAIERRTLELGPLLAEAYDAHEPLAREKGVALEVDTANLGAAQVEGDRDRIVQVLSNLLGNAIKFCHAGESITLRGGIFDRRACVSVTDTGPGIPEQDHSHVFDLYWRGRRGGTGLGLAISRGIVAAHGGHIWVENAAPRGTTFTFTLPLA